MGGRRLHCRLPANVAAPIGAALTLSVRPERVHCLMPGESTEPGWNVLDGVVHTTFFHGSTLRVQVTLGEMTLSCDLGRRPASELALSSGSAVRLGIAPEDIVVLAGSLGHRP